MICGPKSLRNHQNINHFKPPFPSGHSDSMISTKSPPNAPFEVKLCSPDTWVLGVALQNLKQMMVLFFADKFIIFMYLED